MEKLLINIFEETAQFDCPMAHFSIKSARVAIMVSDTSHLEKSIWSIH